MNIVGHTAARRLSHDVPVPLKLREVTFIKSSTIIDVTGIIHVANLRE